MTEQQLIDLLFFLLRDLFHAVSYYVIFAIMLTPKINRIVFVCVFSALNMAMNYLHVNAAEFVRFCMLLVLVIIPVFACCKDKKRICIMGTGVFFSTMLIADVLISMISLAIWGAFTTNFEVKTWESIQMAVFTDFVLVACYIPVIIIWNKVIRKVNMGTMGKFMLFPFGQVVFLAASSYHTWSMDFVDVLKNPFIILALALSALADIAMYRAIKENDQLADMKLKLAHLEYEAEIQAQYYAGLADKYAEIREYRHDINNLIAVTEAMLNDEGCARADGEAMLNELRDKAGRTAIPVFCCNAVVNALLWQKLQQAQQKGIRLSIDIPPSEDFPMTKTAVCSVFSNLIDNAMRAADETGQGFVNIRSRRDMGMLFIEVKNNTVHRDFSHGAKPCSTKKDAGHNGFELAIIQKITDACNGEFLFESVDHTACACAAFPLDSLIQNELADAVGG